MPEIDENTEELKPAVEAGNHDHSAAGISVMRHVGAGDLAKEFMAPGSGMLENLARSKLADINELQRFMMLYHWAVEYKCARALHDLEVSLIGRTAVGGYNRSLAAMVKTGIIAPEGMGIELSNKGSDALRKANETKQRRGESDQHPA